MDEKTYTLGWYLVGFLDVLGQREKLRNLRLPNRKEEEAVVFESVRSTAGVVLGIRRLFRETFESFEAAFPNPQPGAGKIVQVPDLYGFSDSFVISLPLGGDREHLKHLVTPLIGSYCALSTACVVMISAFASKQALRGGIEVGLGLNISPGEIYGPGLERAYFLECRQARYPRILIGDELWKFLSLGLVETEKITTNAGKAMNEIIHKTMELSFVDTDGLRALDYLGPGVVIHSPPNFATHSVKPAYDFVLEQQRLYLSKGDEELSKRYANLRRYFESRLPLWGMAPASPESGKR
jgi:hypothetical protein